MGCRKPVLELADDVGERGVCVVTGNNYLLFDVDWDVREVIMCCSVCETAIEKGWFNQHNGRVYCLDHVMIVGRDIKNGDLSEALAGVARADSIPF